MRYPNSPLIISAKKNFTCRFFKEISPICFKVFKWKWRGRVTDNIEEMIFITLAMLVYLLGNS